MRLLQHLVIFAGLLLSLGQAATTNLDIWDIDESCTNWHDSTSRYTYGLTNGVDQTSTLQEASDDALLMAQAAYRALQYVLAPRPDPNSDPDGYDDWLRIAEAVYATLGFSPSIDQTDDATTGYFGWVMSVFLKTSRTLTAEENNPELGYNPDVPLQPLLVCGDNWQWFGKNDIAPGTNQKMEHAFKDFFDQGVKGGWCKKRRWQMSLTEMGKPIYCEPGTRALVDMRYNLVVLCDVLFTTWKNKPSPKSIVDQDLIDEGEELEQFLESIPVIFFHEMMHWFGGVSRNADGSNNFQDMTVKDQQAVDKNGKLLYSDKHRRKQTTDQPISETRLNQRGWKRRVAYGTEYVWALARSHSDGSVAANSGPGRAIVNADSLTTFAAMMYFDSWSWANGAKANYPGPMDTN